MWVFDEIGRDSIRPDPLVALAVAAAVTHGVELGTCILQVPIREPFDLALRVASVQLVADGRLTLGVGAGSTERDYVATGHDFASRWKNLSRNLAIMEALWRGERRDGIAMGPWPATLGGPDVLIGSWRSRTWIRRAAQGYRGWISSAHFSGWAELAESIGHFHRYGGERAVVANLKTDLRASSGGDESLTLQCPLREARDRLRRLEDLGFTDVVLSAQTLDSISMDRMTQLLG